MPWSLRKKRSLVKAGADPLQARITDYWNTLDSTEKLAHENKQLLSQVTNANLKSMQSGSIQAPPFTNVLKQIIINAERNHGQYPTHWQHSVTLK